MKKNELVQFSSEINLHKCFPSKQQLFFFSRQQKCSVHISVSSHKILRGVLKSWDLIKSIYLLIFGCAGSSLLRRFLSSCGEQGHSPVAAYWLLIEGLLLWSTWALGHEGLLAAAPGLWSMGSIAAAHRLSCSEACGIPRMGGQSNVSCIGSRILHYWAAMEAVNKSLEIIKNIRKKVLK